VRSKLWFLTVLGCFAALVLGVLFLPRSFGLTASSDVIQCLLLGLGVVAFLPHMLRSQGRARAFWGFLALGIGLWFVYQLLWVYFEMVLRQDVPDLFSGDIVLFLHIVPLIAALALRPHIPRDEYAARIGRLDFALLTLWWIYLYILLVMPWQYAVADPISYSRNLNAIYLAEKLVFLVALCACWMGSLGHWRVFYANLFGASLLYAAGSYAANWALARNLYYSGSLYDIPLAASMAWVALSALWAPGDTAGEGTKKASTAYGVWVARSGMIVAFSLPLFGGWVLWDNSVPSRIRSFRLIVTLTAAAAMGVIVFLRQRLLDRELRRLLDRSRDSFESLRNLQAQILQSEKMASIGQFVGGAAHELNNPITAMLGYSDLLLSTQLSLEQKTLATRIGQQVRRTKSLVASLLSFARQTPTTRAAVDLNTLVRTAVKLTQPHWQALKITVPMELDSQLPRVSGNSNQLLQVCLQVIGDALHAIGERPGGILNITTKKENETAIIQVSGDAPITLTNDEVHSAGGDTLGLSACRGILQEHSGRILYECQPAGQAVVRIELPCKPGASLVTEAAAPLPA
jgi:signal transduction histidine kinase